MTTKIKEEISQRKAQKRNQAKMTMKINLIHQIKHRAIKIFNKTKKKRRKNKKRKKRKNRLIITLWQIIMINHGNHMKKSRKIINQTTRE